MSKFKKLKERLSSKPKDFGWSELLKLLHSLDYVQVKTGKTGGSRVRFIHAVHPPVSLHRPHPSPYLNHLKQEGLI